MGVDPIQGDGFHCAPISHRNLHRKFVVIIQREGPERQPDLLEVVHAAHSSVAMALPPQVGHEQRRQEKESEDDDQEFRNGKGTASYFSRWLHCFLPLLSIEDAMAISLGTRQLLVGGRREIRASRALFTHSLLKWKPELPTLPTDEICDLQRDLPRLEP